MVRRLQTCCHHEDLIDRYELRRAAGYILGITERFQHGPMSNRWTLQHEFRLADQLRLAAQTHSAPMLGRLGMILDDGISPGSLGKLMGTVAQEVPALRLAMQESGLALTEANATRMVKELRGAFGDMPGFKHMPAGWGKTTNLLDTRALKNIATQQKFWIGKRYSQHHIDQARKLITKSFGLGYGMKETADWLRMGLFDQFSDYKYWKVLSHSVVHRARTYSGLTAMQEAGFEVYQVMAMWDERMCPICEELDGKQYSVSKAIDKMQESFELDPPEEMKFQSPWLRWDSDAGESYFKDSGGNNVGISGLSPDEQLEKGVGYPPFHGFCRCLTVMVNAYNPPPRNGPISQNQPPVLPSTPPILDGGPGWDHLHFVTDTVRGYDMLDGMKMWPDEILQQANIQKVWITKAASAKNVLRAVYPKAGTRIRLFKGAQSADLERAILKSYLRNSKTGKKLTSLVRKELKKLNERRLPGAPPIDWSLEKARAWAGEYIRNFANDTNFEALTPAYAQKYLLKQFGNQHQLARRAWQQGKTIAPVVAPPPGTPRARLGPAPPLERVLPRNMRSLDDIRAWMRATINKTNIGDSFDPIFQYGRQEISVYTARRLANMFHRLFNETGIRASITRLRIETTRETWYAFCQLRPNKCGLGMNSKWFGKGTRTARTRQFNYDVSTKHHSKLAPGFEAAEAVMTHEVGHALYNGIMGAERGLVSDMIPLPVHEAAKKVVKIVRKQHRALKASRGRRPIDETEFVSRYGMKNRHEYFAEAFAQQHCGYANNATARLWDSVEEYLDACRKANWHPDDIAMGLF